MLLRVITLALCLSSCSSHELQSSTRSEAATASATLPSPPVDADPSQPLSWSPADVFRVVLDQVDRPDTLTLDAIAQLATARVGAPGKARVTSLGADQSYQCTINSDGVPQPELGRVCDGQATVRRIIVFGRANGGPGRDDQGLALSNDEFASFQLFKPDVLKIAAAKGISVRDVTHDRWFEQAHNVGHMPSLIEASMLVSAAGRRVTIVTFYPDQTVETIITYTGS